MPITEIPRKWLYECDFCGAQSTTDVDGVPPGSGVLQVSNSLQYVICNKCAVTKLFETRTTPKQPSDPVLIDPVVDQPAKGAKL